MGVIRMARGGWSAREGTGGLCRPAGPGCGQNRCRRPWERAVGPRRGSSSVLFVLLAAAAAAVAQTAPSASAPAGPPRLSVEPARLDFGTLWYGEPCELSVALRNVGGAALEIREVKSSCGCTAARLEKNRLEPGETVRLKITYDTRKGQKKVSQNVTILTNDPVQAEHHVSIVGEVHNIYDGDPTNYLVLGMVPYDQVTTRTLDLVCNAPGKVLLQPAPLPSDSPIDVRLEPVEEGRRYRMVVTTRPPMPIGPVNVKVNFTTTSLKFPTLTVPVNGRAVEHVSVVPDQIGLTPRNDKPSRRLIMVNYPPEDDLHVTRVESSHPSVTTTMGPRASAPPNSAFAQQQIYVHLPAFTDLPEDGVLLTIFTDAREPRLQQLKVRIHRINVAPRHDSD